MAVALLRYGILVRPVMASYGDLIFVFTFLQFPAADYHIDN